MKGSFAEVVKLIEASKSTSFLTPDMASIAMPNMASGYLGSEPFDALNHSGQQKILCERATWPGLEALRRDLKEREVVGAFRK